MGALAAGLASSAAPKAFAVAALAACGGLGLSAWRPALALLAAGLVLSGLAIGEARLAAADRPGERLRDGQQVRGVAVALERPRPGPFGESLQLELRSGPARGARVLGRVRTPVRLEPGSLLAVAGSFERLRGHGGYSGYLRGRGVAGELQLERASPSGGRRGGLRGALDRIRGRAERGVASGLPSAEAALLRGMVLGQDEAIGKAVRMDWRRSGLAHLFACYQMVRTLAWKGWERRGPRFRAARAST